MILRFPSALLLLWIAFYASSGVAADLKNRSASRTGQFIVYCDDRVLRSRVVSHAEELKTDVLQVLREPDGWSQRCAPLVISIDPADPDKPALPVRVQWVNTVAGPKIDVVVKIGEDPHDVFLQRHLVRAMLLELCYRDRPAPKAGERYMEPPWWLVEGIIENIRVRNGVGRMDVFKSIVSTDKLPALDRFLAQPPVHLDTVAGEVDRACAMCLVEALLALPNGGPNLLRFLQSWPDANGDTLAALGKQFPALAGSQQSLAKWWSLHLARFAGGDRFSGMTLEDTDRELEALLSIEVPGEKGSPAQKYAVRDFPNFVKLRAAKTALQVQQVKIVTLGTKAHPLFRPIITEYEQILSQLSQRKTRRIAERIAEIEDYRRTIVQRVTEITDYLNWYEATQPVGRTGVFDQYIRRVRKLSTPEPCDPRISAYLDQLEPDFAPLAPNSIPGMVPAEAANR